MSSVKLFVLVVVCVSFAATRTPPTPPPPKPHCWGSECGFRHCVDPVHDPAQCCPVCPNGPNCKHPDGTIIKEGATYNPDPHTSCMCPQNTFGFHASVALCIGMAPQPVTVQAVS